MGKMEPSPKRFLADVMLGRLAKWLRIIGYDTLYFRDMDDRELIRRALEDDRILLTRDRELSRRDGFRVLLIADENLEPQLAQVLREMDLRPRMGRSIRCPLCNRALGDVPRDAVRDMVPRYVWDTYRDFSRCPGCGKIFWKGTHWDSIRRRLQRVGCSLPADGG
jgi:uncharacterized protein with PIN domain